MFPVYIIYYNLLIYNIIIYDIIGIISGRIHVFSACLSRFSSADEVDIAAVIRVPLLSCKHISSALIVTHIVFQENDNTSSNFYGSIFFLNRIYTYPYQ